MESHLGAPLSWDPCSPLAGLAISARRASIPPFVTISLLSPLPKRITPHARYDFPGCAIIDRWYSSDQLSAFPRGLSPINSSLHPLAPRQSNAIAAAGPGFFLPARRTLSCDRRRREREVQQEREGCFLGRTNQAEPIEAVRPGSRGGVRTSTALRPRTLPCHFVTIPRATVDSHGLGDSILRRAFYVLPSPLSLLFCLLTV